MRVLLVGPDLESNLSLRYLASSLQAAGHQPRIATFDTMSDAPTVLAAAEHAELIGLSMCFQVRAREFLALAQQLKAAAPKRPVIAGGHFASCAATELLEHHPELDVIVIHEGEQAIVELANLGPRLVSDAGTLEGVAVRTARGAQLTKARTILDDLDVLPEPDREGPARLLAGVPTAYMMGSRGCVNACDYCCITTLHRLAPGKRFRQRSPEKVAGEMAGLFHKRGVRQFVFHDDNFLVPSYAHNQARIERIATALERNRVKDIALVLKCSPQDAEPRILARLKELGLIRIFMGIESGTQCGLDAIGRKQTVAEAERALTLCEELDLSSQYTLITFHPEATPESMLEDLAFARRHPAHPLNYCRAEVYAGTPLEKRLLDSGRAIGDFMGRVYRYTDARVEQVWDLGKDLFAGRCWGHDELLGQAIRLDHQVTVLRHFYEGAAVKRVDRTWRELQVELNLDTVELFSELVQRCVVPDQRVDVSDLERRERRSRELLLRRLCELRADVEACTRVALPEAVRPPAPKQRFRSVVPRHAAAVAVALGLTWAPLAAAQDGGKQPPVLPGKRKPGKKVTDAGVPIAPAPPPWRDDHGVAEAAPPPYDRYKQDIGVAEAAPPPYDYRNDLGVAEAAPPPYPAGWGALNVVSGELIVYLADVGKVSGPVAVAGKKNLVFKVNGKTGDLLFTLTLQQVGRQLVVQSVPSLQAKLDGKSQLTPTSFEWNGGGNLELTEPVSKAKLRLVFKR